MSYYNRNKVISIELPVNEALEHVISVTSEDFVLESLDERTVYNSIKVGTFIDYHGEDEILSHISDSAIEEEFYRRTPLAKALQEGE